MLLFSKRFVTDSGTRTCHAWNTYVSRVEHERATRGTRTCNARNTSVQRAEHVRVTVNVTKNSDIKKES